MTAQVIHFIKQELLNGAEVSEEQDLLLSGLMDSIGVMRLVTFIEEEVGIEVPAEDVTIENFTSMETLKAYLEARC